ncbi:phosphoribosylglycinamide formyltransferase [Microbaculum marinum]|uniref:Phosphoribosylglycinamide formyltransferase n=1 Tax=Microbaculum marinum TaxID=1764581 RepID=A0AAW9S142_9HYPH
MNGRVPVAIMISGRGSNMAALVEASRAPDFPAEIVLVLSNRPDAKGLETASAAGIATEVIDYRGKGSRKAFEEGASSAIERSGAEIICLAGFMRLLSPGFVERWHDRLINIHPSLLPAFPGLNTHERALEAGVKITGCTVHFVRAEMDNGPIIVQAAVPVSHKDTAETLAKRVLAVEHRVYPLALRLVATGRARLVGDRVFIDEDVTDLPALAVPPVSLREVPDAAAG